MARPQGYRLNRLALEDLLEAKQITMTEASVAVGLAPDTLGKMARGQRGASMKTVRALAASIGCSAETLFPELAKFQRPEAIAEVAS